jgi:hypothetical protein
MNIIFDPTITQKKELKETNFSEFVANINPAFYYPNLVPYIKDAVRTYIYPYFGRTFYETVVAHNTTDAVKDEIRELMSSAIAKYAVYFAMPHINVTISDMGVQQNRNEKSSNSSQWAFQQARWAMLYSAERALDDLLNFCYDNKSNAWLSGWTASDEYKHTFTDFISGRKELSKISGIKTMRAFWSVVPFIKKSEDETKKILGYRQYDNIKTKLTTGTAKEKELIKLIRYHITESAIYEALPSMTVLIEDGSIFSISVSDMPNIGTNSANNITMINTLRQQCKEKAAYYQNEIRNYLHIYKDDFTFWKEDCYIEERPRSVFHSEDEIGGIML